jgi:integrase
LIGPLELVQMLRARGVIAASRIKDVKTSLQKLADASQVPLKSLDLSAIASTYEDTLKTYFAELTPPASPSTQRNTRQNLRQLYRLLDESAVLPRDRRRTPSTRQSLRAMRTEIVQTSPYKSHYNRGRYGVPQKEWPADIAQQWQRYCVSRALDMRETTRVGYDGWLACYVGYNLSVEQPPIERWDQLFDADRLVRFVTWHAKRVGDRTTRTSVLGVHVVDLITMLAEQLDRPEILALRKLKRRLPKPAPMHQTKRPEHTFTLQELDAVGLALIAEGTRPFVAYRRLRHPGLLPAIRYQTGLLVRLWIRVPLRRKSLCDMDLQGRLYRDDHGQWQLYYRGDQLKVDEYLGDTNEFAMPWPPELVEHLERYLQEYRPRFPRADADRHLFLSEQGDPLSGGAAWNRFRLAIYQALHKRIWPHLLRKLWADAYLDAHPGDFEGAAAMLNNTPQMVQARYRHFRREQHLRKAVDFNAKLFKAPSQRP